ncbi:MAG: hypothetical protein ACJAX9_002954 [Celeribacter sp.]|jgi:hypothetical protein
MKGTDVQTTGQTIGILIATAIVAAFLIWPRLAKAKLWRASITPLASIIGSGFLVLGPILAQAYGLWTPVAMALLCGMAYAIGSAVRFNIMALDREAHVGRTVWLESLASWALAFAYIISVAYYLNLLGSFAVSLTPWNTAMAGRIVTSAVYAVILSVGWTKGFHALERLEQLSVGLKLAIIGGLLFGLGWCFAQTAQGDALVFAPATQTGWAGLSLLFGLLVTVQGFETSRYLGQDYDAVTRVRSMRIAQGVSTAIYMIYVAFIAYVFRPDQIGTSETAIIDMMVLVAPILPILLVLAALAAQFSAAVADTSGAGGLISELTQGRIPVKFGYVLLVGFGVAITWGADVFQIISWASKAFAAYYALQAAIAVGLAKRDGAGAGRVMFFAAISALAVAAMIFGTAVE